jgi:uncharacterized protein (TIGR03086 family)
MDDELVQMFLAGTTAFGERVHAITEGQWTAGTPDTEWSVADLVAHLVDEHRWAAPLLHGLDFAAAGEVVEGTRQLPVDGGVGANLAQSWDEAAAGSVDAVVADGALDQMVSLSRGQTAVSTYLTEMVLDLVVHSWDLATAIGYPDQLPTDLVEFAYHHVDQLGDVSSSGMFAAPVDVPDDASTLDKLIAATGRDPRA